LRAEALRQGGLDCHRLCTVTPLRGLAELGVPRQSVASAVLEPRISMDRTGQSLQ
jgi:hypothetical protein